MPLTPIGDIAAANLSGTVAETLTWETATDWDNYTDRLGVVHDTVGDRNDASVLRIGYPTDMPGLAQYNPFDEDSGSTAADVVGSNDGSIQSGVTPGVEGVFGTTGFDHDGTTTGRVDFDPWSRPGDGSAITFAYWEKTTSSGGKGMVSYALSSTNDNEIILYNPGDLRAFWDNDGGNNSGFSIADGNWHLTVWRWRSSDGQADIYADASQVHSQTQANGGDIGDGGRISTHQEQDAIGDYDGTQAVNGVMDELLVFDTYLTNQRCLDLYLPDRAYLTTNTKSFSTGYAPDLQNLDYSLNGQTITLDVIGSPGTASEEIVSQTLDGSTSYSLTWSNTHTDFRVKIKPRTTDVTVTPTVNRVELTN